jgi:hypothetical protein
MNVVLENNLWLILTVWGTTSSSGRYQIPSSYMLLNSEDNPELRSASHGLIGAGKSGINSAT